MASEKKLREQVLEKLDAPRFYEEVEELELTELSAGQYIALCPFHDDHEPSMSISEEGLFHCFSCQAQGSVFDFWMKRHSSDSFRDALEALAEFAEVDIGTKKLEPIPEDLLERWSKALFSNAEILAYLHEYRGLTDETLKRFKIGWDGERITIPVFDLSGKLVNIRRYLRDATSVQRKMKGYKTGYNKARLFLAKMVFAKDPKHIIICEGEWDAILMHQLGFENVVTVTGGAGTWNTTWTSAFKGKIVWLVFDNDEAGRIGMGRVAQFLYKVADEIHTIVWPVSDDPTKAMPAKGDITDWIVKLKWTPEALNALIDASPVFTIVEAIKSKPLPVDLAFTDVGNGHRLVAKFGESIRYCPAWKSWYEWDGVRWRRDELRYIETRAKIVAEAIRKDVDPAVLDPTAWAEIQKFSLKSESLGHIKAMIEMAASEPPIATRVEDWDSNGFLLTVLNGTVDLRTGLLLPPNQKHMITKQAPVIYDPEARSDTWESFLKDVTQGDEELEDFLQRACGYCLTGDTREEKLFFIHGPTAAGKSTFLEAIKAAMGEYSQTANFNTFLEQKSSDGRAPNHDIARMRGMRFIVSIEVDEGKKIAEGLVKQLTGGDKMTARQLYQEAFDFMPTAKLWLSANHKPRVSDEDDAIWRRILLIPFEKAIPPENRNPAIKIELLDPKISGSAILAWLVKGCLAWQKSGLGRVVRIDQATLEYRAEQDPISDWYNECCEAAENAELDNKIFVSSYIAWCRDNNVRYTLTGRSLSLRLNARGFDVRKVDGKTMRVGLRLRADARRYARPEDEEKY